MLKPKSEIKEEFKVLQTALKSKKTPNIRTTNRMIMIFLLRHCPENHGIALSNNLNNSKSSDWKEFIRESSFCHAAETQIFSYSYQVGTHYVAIYPNTNNLNSLNLLIETLLNSSWVDSQIIEDYAYFKL